MISKAAWNSKRIQVLGSHTATFQLLFNLLLLRFFLGGGGWSPELELNPGRGGEIAESQPLHYPGTS